MENLLAGNCQAMQHVWYIPDFMYIKIYITGDCGTTVEASFKKVPRTDFLLLLKLFVDKHVLMIEKKINLRSVRVRKNVLKLDPYQHEFIFVSLNP